MNVEILGNVQDGGVPHLGCECKVCEKAREDPSEQKQICSILLKQNGNEDTVRYLVDATPDIRNQIKGDYLDGVFLTHGHIGTTTGLLYFGEQSMDISSLPVYGTEKTLGFLRKNDPYRYIIDRENIVPNQIEDGEEQNIQGGSIEVRKLHHRHVNTDCVSFMIKGDEKKLFYLSDTKKMTENIKESIGEADIAIVDGTFWSEDEIDRYDEVGHPTIKNLMELFSDLDTDIYFTHLNHTNPVLMEDSEERKKMEEKGYQIVEKGMEFEI